MTNSFTDRDGLRVNQVESTTAQKASRFEQPTDERRELVQASKPLLVRTESRKSGSKIPGDKVIGLFERSDTEKALHQADSDYFRIREEGRSVWRATPVRQARVGFEEVIDEAEDVSHLVYNGRQMGRPPSVEIWFAP